jgi:hypothetical protein
MNPEDAGKIGRVRFKRSWLNTKIDPKGFWYGCIIEMFLMSAAFEYGIPCEVIP